ncbi:MAG: bacteriophage holin [Alphaproteobacteria bacterium]|jgi:hypothetical protein
MTQSPQSVTLGVISLGLAFGITWSTGMIILGVAGAVFGYGLPVIDAMSSVYLGFGASVGGALVGALWGFVDGFTGGVVIAWLYNYFARRQAGQPPPTKAD